MLPDMWLEYAFARILVSATSSRRNRSRTCGPLLSMTCGRTRDNELGIKTWYCRNYPSIADAVATASKYRFDYTVWPRES